MKNYYFLFIFLIIFTLSKNVRGQGGQWVWINGDSTANSIGNYGIQGISSPTNEPPALYEPCEWTDLNGNYWMFGGYGLGTGGRNSALWKYNTTTNEWTWISGTNTTNNAGNYGSIGIQSPFNLPPSRGWGAVSWVDLNGNFWLFGGGDGSGSGFSDLWKYDITSNEWTWMKGTNLSGQPAVYGIRGVPNIFNTPGTRWEASASWTDNFGDLWLFGGQTGSSTLNDLWKYNIATNTWTWMNGSNSFQNGIYGILGVEDSLNTPGSRMAYCRWKDNSGYLWLFAGGDFGSANYFNDLWRYNVITNKWAWMSGSNAYNSPGIYGTKCNTSISNIPCQRYEDRAAWKDSNGNLWLFGGGGSGYWLNNVLNDLWKYCISTNQWAWVKGDSTSNPTGNWGTKGVPNIINQPNGRAGAVGWSDNNNQLYLFGGINLGSFSYNDLWKFIIDTSCAPCSALIINPTANFNFSDSTVCSGDCINFTNLSQHSTSYHWIFPGGTPSSDTSANPQGICYFNSGSFDATLIATNSNGSDTLTLPNFINVSPQIQFSALTQNGDTLFSISGYSYYEWYNDSTLINGANNYYYIAMHSGNYSVVVTDSNGCHANAQKLNVIASVNNVQSSINDFDIHYYSGNLYLEINSYLPSSSIIQLTDALGKEIWNGNIFLKSGKNEMVLPVENFSAGIYFVKVLNSSKAMTSKIFIR